VLQEYLLALSAHCIFGHKQRSKRFLKLLAVIGTQIEVAIPQCFSNRSQSKGAYRFLSNKNVAAFMILAAERDRLVELIRQSKPGVVLAIQDTTTLDYSTNRASSRLQILQNEHQKGFYAHNHLLVSEQGVPLGVFDQYTWNRRLDELGVRKAKRRSLPIEAKESYRWLQQTELLQDTFAEDQQTTFIELCDREGDIHEVLECQQHAHIHYLIRARGDRIEQESNVAIRPALLQKWPEAQGTFELDILDSDPAKRRTAQLEIRYASFTLRPCTSSKARAKRKAIELQVVWAREVNDPQQVSKTIDWLLFTTLPVNSVADALQMVQYYKLRWRIEQFHYVLKVGCRIEELQLKEPQSLENAIALYSLLAVQVLSLQFLAREQPLAPMQIAGFDPIAYKAGVLYLKAKAGAKYDPDKPNPTITDILQIVAQIGGSTLQKGKPIGSKIIWRGLKDLQLIVQAFEIFNNLNSS
jgi:Transposase DNA-binding/Transposase DDE domain